MILDLRKINAKYSETFSPHTHQKFSIAFLYYRNSENGNIVLKSCPTERNLFD